MTSILHIAGYWHKKVGRSSCMRGSPAQGKSLTPRALARRKPLGFSPGGQALVGLSQLSLTGHATGKCYSGYMEKAPKDEQRISIRFPLAVLAVLRALAKQPEGSFNGEVIWALRG